MPRLIWIVFLVGAFAARYYFGVQGRIVYAIVILVVVLLFRRQLSIGLTHVASKLGLMKATIDKMPLAIKLVRASAMDPNARQLAAELSAVGFVDAGAWDIPPMPKIKLALMVNPVENFLAAIETASSIGAQVNIHTLYSDGRVTTYTNSELPAPKAQRPGVTSVRMPGVSVATLVLKARMERRRDGITPVSAEDAPRIYERLYAESIRFRKVQGA
jgi:hypothetical protein